MSKSLRSALFHNAAGMKDTFREHMSNIWKYGSSQKRTLLDGMASILASKTEKEKRMLTEVCVGKLGGEANSAVKAIAVLSLIADWWYPGRDEPGVVMQDIAMLNALPEGAKARKEATAFLQRYLAFLQKDSLRRIRIRTANASLPTLVNLTTNIDLRAVVLTHFDWNLDDPKTYKPKVDSFVDVAILRFKLDEGEPVIFQCDLTEIRMIIKRLQATAKEMELAKGYLKRKKS